ncbi:hypothetical protein ACTMU2_11710 [Cupriavidus basilensis]
MDADSAVPCLQRIAGAADRLAFEGFHFHLGGYGWEARGAGIARISVSPCGCRGLHGASAPR